MNQITQWPMMASTGEAVLFSIVAVVMILGALGVLFFKKAAYAALSMVCVMLGLAILYVATGAPFLGTTQVIVYTGAIMMLFLFVVMMIGLSATDEYQTQARGRVMASILGSAGVGAVLAGVVFRGAAYDTGNSYNPEPYSDESITDLAVELFSKHWFSMELAGALLITAAIGAILLTHTDKLGPKAGQHTMAEAKMRAYKERERHMGQLPAPGVYASSNAFDAPAISGETLGPVEESIPRVLRVRGLNRTMSAVDAHTAAGLQVARDGEADSLFGPGAAGNASQSGAWGMPGAEAPTGMRQPTAAPLTSAGALEHAEDSLVDAEKAPEETQEKEA